MSVNTRAEAPAAAEEGARDSTDETTLFRGEDATAAAAAASAAAAAALWAGYNAYNDRAAGGQGRAYDAPAAGTPPAERRIDLSMVCVSLGW